MGLTDRIDAPQILDGKGNLLHADSQRDPRADGVRLRGCFSLLRLVEGR